MIKTIYYDYATIINFQYELHTFIIVNIFVFQKIFKFQKKLFLLNFFTASFAFRPTVEKT